jgi:hypothetical protein
MRRNPLPFERRAGRFRTTGVFGDETLDCIATESGATDAGKERIFRLTVAFTKPSLQHLCRFRTEWSATLFSAFPEAAHMGSGSQDDILAVQPNQLGYP